MDKGTPFREETQDSLQGRTDVEPVTLTGPGLLSPAPVRSTPPSAQLRVLDSLGTWAGEKLRVASDTRNSKDQLSGAMAAQQGKTLEEIDMAGNKWALEGHSLMDAQTVSSSLLAAQRQEIQQGAHTLSPDQFRERYVSRLESAVADLDPRTAELVEQQMAEHMPLLVGEHTAQHVSYLEQENWNSLERSIDIISRDPTATTQLVDFARGGQGSPSDGLSEDRRKSATVSGVIRAFDNDNPLAYSTLVKESLLGDNLTTAQQNQIRAAQQRFEGRRRSEYNETLFNGEQELMSRVESGQLDPSDAVEELSLLYAEHDINMTASEAGVVYEQAEQGQQTERLTRGALIDAAMLRGERSTAANIIMDSLTVTESGGNVGAFRTNKDGRSFGGLLQMGPGRLQDYANATGTPALSPSEYAKLPASKQRLIGRWHIEELIEQANATGAIGKTINGVTVTLSGLVAVGHLGGAGGMQRFVSSKGTYNPADELGTSLTDYLRSHGSGEMTEFMSPSQKLDYARSNLNTVRERLAMDVYEQLTPKLAESDDRFRQGLSTRAEWEAERDALFARYDSERTRADVNSEISTARAVDVALSNQVDQTQDQEYALRLEQADMDVLPSRLAWEEILNNPASTPEEIRAATQAYVGARKEVFDAHGIEALDRDNADTLETVLTTTREAMERHRVHVEEGALIDNARTMGYLSELPAALQERAFKEQEERILQDAENAVAEGRLSVDDAPSVIANEVNTFIAQSGMTDPKMTRRMSAALRGPLIDAEGNPNPMVVDVVEQYATIKAMNPYAAKTFLDDEARVKAEAILSRAEDATLIGEATRTLGLESKDSPLRENTDEFLARRDVQQETDRVVKEFLDSGNISVLEAVFSEATLDQVRDTNSSGVRNLELEQTQERVQGEFVEEISRLQQISPQFRPKELANMALENLERRSSLIGGHPVILSPGSDLPKNFFGDRAGEFMHEGAINSAVSEWLRSDEALEQYPELDDVATGENLPGFLQSTIDFGAGIIGLDFEPAIAMRDARSTRRTGLRPYVAFAAKGDIVVQFLRPTGDYSEEIVIPQRRAGQLYMQRRRKELTQ